MKRTALILVLLFLGTALLRADGMRYIRGVVRDSVSDEPLNHASVTIDKSSTGAITDNDGIFEMSIPSKAKFLTVSCLGYEKKTVAVNRSTLNLYAVYLSPSPKCSAR